MILQMSVSLDGFVARCPGEIDWLQRAGEPFDACATARHAANLGLIGRAGGIVLGRNAYEEMGPAPPASLHQLASLIRHTLADGHYLTIQPVALGDGLTFCGNSPNRSA